MLSDSTTPSKICSKCGESKPATTEFFYHHPKTRDRLRPHCKVCAFKRMIELYDANKDHINERRRARRKSKRPPEPVIPDGCKRCSTCGEIKSVSEFQPHKQSKDGLRGFCKVCLRNYVKSYGAATRERKAEYRRNYYASNKDRESGNARAYRNANRERVRAIGYRRRVRQHNAEGSHSADDIKRQYDAQKGRCYYCDARVGDSYHVDHVIPLARGGSNGPENIVIACPPCNLSKNDKLPHEWSQGGRLL